MAGLYSAQVRLAATSTIPADAAVNTWHFDVGTGFDPLTDTDIITGQRDGLPDQNGIHGDLCDFYDTLGGLFSDQIDWASSTIKYTNLLDPKPRVPLIELPMDPVPVSTSPPMPAEVAIVSSFEATPTAGINQARRRNRVFLGPLGTGVLGAAGDNAGLLLPITQTVITDAMSNLAGNSNNANDWVWVVYSPTAGTYTAVDRGWVDNSFDSQRRRGIEATNRVNWVNAA